jgi:hypothetical protein
MRRWGLAAALACLVALGTAWGTPRATAPAQGAGPASVYVALPAGVAQLAVPPRADPREPTPLAPPPPSPVRSLPGAAAAAEGARSAALSPVAVPVVGGRSPPAASA